MRAPWKLVLMILACLLFMLAGLGGLWPGPNPGPWPWNGRLIAWGLFCWALSDLVS